LDALAAAVEALDRSSDPPEPAPSVAVQATSATGTLVELGLWAPDAIAMGRSMLTLRQAVPDAIFSVPGASALPANAVPPSVKRPRITRERSRTRQAARDAAP
jgi:hypothetical protein